MTLSNNSIKDDLSLALPFNGISDDDLTLCLSDLSKDLYEISKQCKYIQWNDLLDIHDKFSFDKLRYSMYCTLFSKSKENSKYNF